MKARLDQIHRVLGDVPRGLGATRIALIAGLLVPLITATAFLPTLQNAFVEWDDNVNFLHNPSYRGLGWTQIRWMFTTFHMGHYIPVTWLTLGLDYVLWGMNPLGYHLHSLLLHMANAGLVYLIALRVLGGRQGSSVTGPSVPLGAAVAALFFAVHPLRVESVAWITERRDVLCGVAYLGAILAYLRASSPGAVDRWRLWYGLAVLLAAIALLSKALAVSLPVILLLLDVYILRRIGPGPTEWFGPRGQRVMIEKIPFVLLAAAASVTAVVARVPPPVEPTLAERLAISVYAVAFYVWKTILPLNLAPLYELPQKIEPISRPFLMSAMLILGITAAAFVLRRRWPALVVGWMAYLVILLPVVGIVQNGGPQIAADRYTYLASIVPALLIGSAVRTMGLTAALSGRATIAAALLAVTTLTWLMSLTWRQVQVWRDSETLWAHAVVTAPSARGHSNLGLTLALQGRHAEAIGHYEEALRIMPRFAEAHFNLGAALIANGKLMDGVERYREALRIRPNYPEVRNNMGVLLAQQGRWAEAAAEYSQALAIRPHYAEAHDHLAAALAQQGRWDEAIEHHREALRTSPGYARAHNSLGVTLTRLGRMTEALEHFQEAVRLQPGDAVMRNNLGLALAQTGQTSSAAEQFREAVRLRPTFPEANANLDRAVRMLSSGIESKTGVVPSPR